MGCDYYNVPCWIPGTFGKWGDTMLFFGEEDDSTICLCTFPFNYRAVGFGPDEVRSLALLGAAVVLAHHGELTADDYHRLPDSLPQWIRDGIDAALRKEAIP